MSVQLDRDGLTSMSVGLRESVRGWELEKAVRRKGDSAMVFLITLLIMDLKYKIIQQLSIGFSHNCNFPRPMDR